MILNVWLRVSVLIIHKDKELCLGQWFKIFDLTCLMVYQPSRLSNAKVILVEQL